MFMHRVLVMMVLSSGFLCGMNRETQFFLALKKNKTEDVKSYLAEGMSVNAQLSYRNFKGVTPVMVTALYDCNRTLELLLKQPSVLVDLRDKQWGDTALIMAARAGHYRVVRQLLDVGANRFLKNKRRWTAYKEAYRSPFYVYAPGYREDFERVIIDLEIARQVQYQEESERKAIKL
jgi:hypothetical protein